MGSPWRLGSKGSGCSTAGDDSEGEYPGRLDAARECSAAAAAAPSYAERRKALDRAAGATRVESKQCRRAAAGKGSADRTAADTSTSEFDRRVPSRNTDASRRNRKGCSWGDGEGSVAGAIIIVRANCPTIPEWRWTEVNDPDRRSDDPAPEARTPEEGQEESEARGRSRDQILMGCL